MQTLARSIGSTAILILALLSFSGIAEAGGWWSATHLDDRYLVIGERVESPTRTEVIFESADAAARARAGIDRYHAYLIPDLDWRIVDEAMGKEDPGDWWVPPPTAILAGSTTIGGGDANLARVSMTLQVPDLEPGPYALMLCDAGCAHPLADVVPSRVFVTADAMTAGLGRRLDRAKARLADAMTTVRILRREVRDLGRVARRELAEKTEVTELRDELGSLRTRMAELSNERGPDWLTAAGWSVAGAALALALRRGRRDGRRLRSVAPRRPEPVPMEDAASAEPTSHRAPVRV